MLIMMGSIKAPRTATKGDTPNTKEYNRVHQKAAWNDKQY